MAESWWERTKKTFEHSFHPANAVAGVCGSPTIEQVQDLLEHAEKMTQRAKTVGAFANSSGALGLAGERMAAAAEKLNKLTERSKTIIGDVKAACDISEAVSVLNDWSLPNSRVSNAEAAKAFDKLFGGVADYFEKLPPPANSYAKVLSEISRVSFFSNMQALMDPTNPRNPEVVNCRNWIPWNVSKSKPDAACEPCSVPLMKAPAAHAEIATGNVILACAFPASPHTLT